MPKVLKWFRLRSCRFAIVFGLALRGCARRFVQQFLILGGGTGREGGLLEDVLQMFPRLGLERFPVRAGTSLRCENPAPRPKKRKRGSDKPAPRLSSDPRADK